MPAINPYDLGAQFAAIGDAQVLASDSARCIEGELRVRLPEEFGRICEFLDGTPFAASVGLQDGTQSYADGVISTTSQLRRELGLPGPYVVLAADNEVVLLLACAGAMFGAGRVHLMPRDGVSRLAIGHEPVASRSWPSFVEYFADALAGDRSRDGG